MLTLYLVRHGQTDLSRANQFCGDLDIPLNETGTAMAEALGLRYGGDPWAGIYASPRNRARATAQPVARRAGLEVQVLEGLREISYGEWEGKPEEEVAHMDPERFAAWGANPADVAPPGGETGRQIAVRALAAVEEVRARHAEGQVLLVSHKATLRVLLCALLGDVSHLPPSLLVGDGT